MKKERRENSENIVELLHKEIQNHIFPNFHDWLDYFGGFSWKTYEVAACQVMLFEIIRELSIECKERGQFMTKIFKIHQDQVFKLVNNLFKQADERYKYLVKEYEKLSSRWQEIEEINENHLNKLIDENAKNMELTENLETTRKLLGKEVKANDEITVKWGHYNSHLETFLNNYEKALDQAEFLKNQIEEEEVRIQY